jgi:hypothetical protein
MLKEAFILCYFSLVGRLISANTRIEHHRGRSLATLVVEALLGFAIIVPLTVPLILDFMAATGVLR